MFFSLYLFTQKEISFIYFCRTVLLGIQLTKLVPLLFNQLNALVYIPGQKKILKWTSQQAILFFNHSQWIEH